MLISILARIKRYVTFFSQLQIETKQINVAKKKLKASRNTWLDKEYDFDSILIIIPWFFTTLETSWSVVELLPYSTNLQMHSQDSRT